MARSPDRPRWVGTPCRAAWWLFAVILALGCGGTSLRGELPQSTRVHAAGGALLGELPAPDHGFRDWVPLSEIPDPVVEAVLATEDARFRWHPGIDPLRIGGALLANLREGRVTQGASTITQQLARSIYLDRERTVARKLKEVGAALWLELRYDKDAILEAYLNEVYWGQARGRPIHGIGPAAQRVFGKAVAELELAEAALLAGMIQAPNALDPFAHPAAARERRGLVLGRMFETGRIDAASRAAADAANLPRRAHALARPRSAAALVHAAAQLRALPSVEDPAGAGLRVRTTIEAPLQRSAERAVATGLADLERKHRRLRSGEPVQAALVAIDPRGGDVLAWVGSRDPARAPFDRAAHAARQPGSVFKPVVALAALRGVEPFTLATLLEDAPLEIATDEGNWRPANLDRRFRGVVSLREALVHSRNVPFVRLALETGLVPVADTARRLGFSGPLRPVPSLALGAFEVTPVEVARAYGVLAAGGHRAAPRFLERVERDGQTLYSAPARHGVRAVSEVDAWLVTSALREAVDRGTARGLRAHGVRGPIAGKTGTSNRNRDAWFVAYTPALVTVVWVGFDDGRPMGAGGADLALPISARFLQRAGTRLAAPLPEPAGIERVAVHAPSGLRAGADCEGTEEVFRAGTAPVAACRSGVHTRLRATVETAVEWFLREIARSADSPS